MGKKRPINDVAYALDLTVHAGWLAGSRDRVKVWVCRDCSAIIADPTVHDNWHRRNRKRKK